MRSTFMGLEASKRGLFTQQSALYTTGHNISNANTVGFSRQRVNMEATLGYPGSGLTAPKTAGHIGTGVQAQSVQRIRDAFIDRQYRQETTKLGYWESRSTAISQMEDIMAEPSEFGLNKSLDLFWESLHDLSGNPDNAGARKVVLQRGQHVADSFNYMHKQLSDIQGNLGNEIKISTEAINSKLKQIADLNAQIQAVEPNGYMPNDLYDARDVLVDELSQYLPVEVERIPSGGNALAIAEGSLTVKMKLNGTTIDLVNGKEYVKLNSVDMNGTTLDGTNLDVGFRGIQYTQLGNPPSTATAGEIAYSDLELSKGKLLSLVNSFGHGGTPGDPTDPPKGYYPEMLANLDKMANAFMVAFNAIHSKGYTLDKTTGQDFFDGTGAGDIKVRQDIIDRPNLIAASNGIGEEGNGKWAIELANMKFLTLDGSIKNIDINKDGIGIDILLPTLQDGANLQSFYQGVIGQLGVDGEQAERLAYNSATIQLTVENNKASVSAVSLDEEMTNMITFQQAYNANARMITVIDETLDKIINGMGRVGL